MAQDLDHALDQTTRLWYWVLPLAGGFGVQVGLFSFIRQAIRKRGKGGTASVGATGGVSAGSMAACCAHHLADVLPFLGLSGVAGFLIDYQTPFIVLGIASNVVGITLMLEVIQRHHLAAWLSRSRLRLDRVRTATLVAAALAVMIVFLVTLWQ